MTLLMIFGTPATKAFVYTPNFLQRKVLFNTSFKCINYKFVATSRYHIVRSFQN